MTTDRMWASTQRETRRSGQVGWLSRAVPPVRAGLAPLVTLVSLAACGQGTPPDHPLAGQAMFALGQEPGWYVDLEPEGEVRFVLDYGTDTVIAETPRPVVLAGDPAARGLIYRVTSREPPLVLTLFDEPCTDAMSGRPFPATATLRMGERELRGCARPDDDQAPEEGA